jgi:hypothetical protein
LADQDSLPEVAAPELEPASPAPEVAEPRPQPLPWTPLHRVGFRIAFLYFLCFIFCFGNGTIFQLFFIVGEWIETGLNWPFQHLAEWTGQHVFHLTGIAAHWHPTGSGDTTLNWIQNGLFLVFALVGGLLWTAIASARGNRRLEYTTLDTWLRFGVRLTCVMFMFIYGWSKLFPLQMAPISIAILNEPLGNTSPMTMLWALIGMHPIYESVCGLAEVVGGLLLMFRRTALAGALFSAFVIANVVLYNFFFDVPVKIFAINLLLALLFLALPDLHALFSFFWKHHPAAPVAVWIPPARRNGFRFILRVVEVVFTYGYLVGLPILCGIGWYQGLAAARFQTPLLGAWHLDAAHPASGPFVTPEGLPSTDLYIDTSQRAFRRSSDGALWRTSLAISNQEHTLKVMAMLAEPVTYAWQMPDPNHLILTSTPPKADPKVKTPPKPFTPAILTLTRIPIPSHYPLLDRGFHFVNQWGLER